jgi:hypothetical protein
VTPAGETESARTTEIKLTPADRLAIYGARRFIGTELETKLKARIPFDAYVQDPLVAAADPTRAFEKIFVPREPNLGDGPTSARFVVVDYDAHTETLAKPAKWNADNEEFLDPDGALLDRENTAPLQFHQMQVWAVVQRALDFFESGFALGRPIPWAFDGSRLIIVPHAGPGENAYYDRQSKSLQFYYYDREEKRNYTCLSTDIINHEFGHAVLDGIRPHFIEAVFPETAAFHEFVGDLAAILILLRNTDFRRHLVDETGGDLSEESTLTAIAEQFGKTVKGKPYLRSARNKRTMKDVANDQRPHFMSEVLTGAMFEITTRLSKYYLRQRDDKEANRAPDAFWYAIQRMQGVAIQPLDLLPPVDVTFRDYALAVLRTDEIANPTDPDDYRGTMLDVFIERGILTESDRETLRKPHQIFERLALDVFHDVDTLASSRANAYRFLDDNRRKLFIPSNADVTVSDLYTAEKMTREARRLPRQVVLQYIWREDVILEGPQFGQFDGAPTSMLCGGTLALNQNGETMAWSRKPGSQLTGGNQKRAAEEQAKGIARKAAFLEALAAQVKYGRIGPQIGGEKGLLLTSVPPMTSRVIDGTVRFQLTPHFGIHDDSKEEQGGRRWQISS